MTRFKRECRECGHASREVKREWTYADAWWICQDRVACAIRRGIVARPRLVYEVRSWLDNWHPSMDPRPYMEEMLVALGANAKLGRGGRP